MKVGLWKTVCGAGALAAASALTSNAGAEIFYGGDTKGRPGEGVELSIHARAGTLLEAIQIIPEYAPVADVLELIELKGMPALTDDGFGDCDSGQVCAVVFATAKSFATDTLLATLRFTIAADAPVGPVPFDAGVVIGDGDVLPIPQAQNFEVLAVPEPQHWALLLAGLGIMALKLKSRRRQSDGTC